MAQGRPQKIIDVAELYAGRIEEIENPSDEEAQDFADEENPESDEILKAEARYQNLLDLYQTLKDEGILNISNLESKISKASQELNTLRSGLPQ